jgi:hypothetical protein
MHLGGGWNLVHKTDRVIELRKDDYTYRRLTGRDGYVRVRAEPGMDRQALINKAVELAQKNDEDLAHRILKQMMPRRTRQYHMRQRELATAFGTPEDPEVIGVKRG